MVYDNYNNVTDCYLRTTEITQVLDVDDAISRLEGAAIQRAVGQGGQQIGCVNFADGDLGDGIGEDLGLGWACDDSRFRLHGINHVSNRREQAAVHSHQEQADAARIHKLAASGNVVSAAPSTNFARPPAELRAPTS